MAVRYAASYELRAPLRKPTVPHETLVMGDPCGVVSVRMVLLRVDWMCRWKGSDVDREKGADRVPAPTPPLPLIPPRPALSDPKRPPGCGARTLSGSPSPGIVDADRGGDGGGSAADVAAVSAPAMSPCTDVVVVAVDCSGLASRGGGCSTGASDSGAPPASAAPSLDGRGASASASDDDDD